MATMIENAAKGQRAAMEGLYAANKKKVFYIAQSLLLDKLQAVTVTTAAFKDMWERLAASGVVSETEFTDLLLFKTVELCKERTLRENPQAFQISDNTNFSLPESLTVIDNCENEQEYVLTNLPVLQRYLFVLHSAGNFAADQIAQILKLDFDMVSAALDAEQGIINRLLSLSEKGYALSCEQVTVSFVQQESSVAIPVRTDERAASDIDAIAAPVENRAKKMKTMLAVIGAVVCMIILYAIYAVSSADKDANASSGLAVPTNTSSFETLDASLTYYADIEVQNYGVIIVQLDQFAAPTTCANFVGLAESGFYDGLTFHRIIDGFMMQGGDPNGNGTGGSGKNIVGEFPANGYDNPLSHTRGALSMARASSYDSASSQFFIVQDDSVTLDGMYAVFGHVTEGMDIVDVICADAEPLDSNGKIAVDEQPVITSVTIRLE